MLLLIDSFDGLPPGGYEPMAIDVIRQLESDDGSEWWLGRIQNEISYVKDGHELTIKYVIVAPGWIGMTFNGDFDGYRVNLAYVIDESLLEDSKIDFTKTDYVAFGSGRLVRNHETQDQKMGFWSKIWGRFR